MKRFMVVLGIILLAASFAIAGAPKSYQVTGPVLELTDDTVTVQKGKDKWELARDKDTKVTGDLKVGQKVTIQYQMKAVSIEVKAEAKKEKAEAKPKAAPTKK